MKREDKEIRDKDEIESIVQRAIVCRIAFSENDVPYIVPVNFGIRDDCLYFHSAAEGKKIEIIEQNNRVCFEVDIDQEVVRSATPCDWGMKYRSVIGFGKAFLVRNVEEKRKALNTIVEHYSGKPSDYPESAIGDVAIIRVEIESMTGRKSGY